jgi:hypothetical protein
MTSDSGRIVPNLRAAVCGINAWGHGPPDELERILKRTLGVPVFRNRR